MRTERRTERERERERMTDAFLTHVSQFTDGQVRALNVCRIVIISDNVLLIRCVNVCVLNACIRT